jgi:hypothetical protein
MLASGIRSGRQLTEAKGCATIEKIVICVIAEPAGPPESEQSAERWIAHGCNNEFPYTVKFTSDGAGGTFFAVQTL